MAEKTRLDIAEDMITSRLSCDCGAKWSIKSRSIYAGREVICRRCRNPQTLSEEFAARESAELDEMVRALAVRLREDYRPPKMAKPKSQREVKPVFRKGYPVNVVGESFYRQAVADCRAGQKVKLHREPGNRHDPKAIMVTNYLGQKIGYIPKDSFIQRLVHEEGAGCTATIWLVNRAEDGSLGVVLDVVVDDRPLGVV